MYEFSLQDLESSDEYTKAPPEIQREYSREYITKNGVDDAVSQLTKAISTPEFNLLPDDEKEDFVNSYLDFYGIQRNQVQGESDEGEALKGLKRGAYQTEGLIGGAIGLTGSLLGLDKMRDFGFDVYKKGMSKSEEHPAKVGRIEDIHGFDDAVDWLIGLGSSQVPVLITTMLSGGIGGAIGKRVLSGVAKKAIEKQVAAGVAKDVATKAVTQRIGTLAGLAAGTAALEGGGMFGEEAEKVGIENANPVSAAALGGVSGLSEIVSPGGKLAARMLGAKAIKGAGKVLGKYGIKIPVTMGKEAGQELFQEFVSKANEVINDPSVPVSDKKAISQYINAAAGGAAFGFIPGVTETFLPEKPITEIEKEISDIPVDADPEEVISYIEKITSADDSDTPSGEIIPEGVEFVEPDIEAMREKERDAEKIKEDADLLEKEWLMQEQEARKYNTNRNFQNAPVGEYIPPELFDIDTETEEQTQGDEFVPRGTPSDAKKAAGVFLSGSTPEMIKVEEREARRDDARYVFSKDLTPIEIKPGIDKIEEQLNQKDNAGFSTTGEGNESEIAYRFPSTAPDWIKQKTLKKYDKKHGTDYAKIINEQSVRSVIKKVRNGGKLTTRQSEIYDYIKSVATDLQQTNHELIADNEFQKIEDEGINIHQEKKVPVGNLSKGDKVVVMENGIPDIMEHKGRDEQGNIVLQDGVTKTVNEFDVLNVIGEKPADKQQKQVSGKSIVSGQEVEINPSEKQKEAGNYKKGKVSLDGMEISIENPIGSTRTGTDQSGKKWSQKIHSDYGYIKGSKGYDKDQVDVFIKPGYTGGSDDVYIVNQHNKDGSFDEHKVILGAKSEQDALNTYKKNYESGWTGGKSVTKMNTKVFNKWVKGNGPKRGQVIRKSTLYTQKPEVKFARKQGKKTVNSSKQKPGIKHKQEGSAKSEIKRMVGEKGFKNLSKFLSFISENKAKKILSGLPVKYMVAWHGSPHDFDEFSIDAIGSGEGAQAYGYGLYFAESKDVAEWYRDQLSDNDDVYYSVDGEKYSFSLSDSSGWYNEEYGELDEEDPTSIALDFLHLHQSDKDDAISDMKKLISEANGENIVESEDLGREYQVDNLEEAIEYFDMYSFEEAKPGHLYKVELAPKEEEYLIWDKPLSEQSEFVKKALEPARTSEFDLEKEDTDSEDGKTAYHRISDTLGGAEEASEYLHSLGIRGIKYFDGSSRIKGEGDYNYVIFDDSDVDIDVKYSKNGKVQGFTVTKKDGKPHIYLIEENIDKGESRQVLLHETGHIFIPETFKGKQWDNLEKTFLKLAKGETKAGDSVRKAIAKVPKDTPKEHRTEEAIAYYITDKANENQTIFRKIIAYIKSALLKIGLPSSILTPDDIVVMAKRYLDKLAKGKIKPKTKAETDVKFKRSTLKQNNDTSSDLTPEQEKFMSKISSSRKKEPIKKRIAESKVLLSDKMRQGFIDQFHSIKKILKDNTAYMMSHLTKSASGALMAAIEIGMPIFDKSGAIDIKKGSKSLKEIFAPLDGEIDRFLGWIAANRAEKLKAEDRENKFTEEDISAGKKLNKGEIKGKSREKIYDEVRKDFEEMNNAIVEIAVKTNLINKEEAERWKDEGFYVPFYRMIEDSTVSAKGPANINALVGQKGYKRLKSGRSDLNDLLTNVLMNWNHLISAGLRNQAGKKALESAEKMKLAEQVPKELKSKNAVYVRENGKEKWYEFDETPESKLVLESLLALNHEELNGTAIKGMRMFKRILTQGVTASPGFKIRNLIRDSLHAPAVSTASKNPVKNIAVGIADRDAMKRMRAGGGAFGESGYIHGSDPEAIKRLVGVSRNTLINSPKKLLKLWEKYQKFGATLENINRVASFKEDIEKGKTLLEANFNSRDQMDFSRAGSFQAVRILAQTVPFFNARLQGLDKLARSLSDKNQQKQFAQVVGMYTLASVALMLMMSDDDDYKDAQEWEKRTYHMFKVPGSNKIYRIPRPFEVGAIAYSIEKLTQQFTDKNSKIPELGDALLHTFSDTLSMNLIPQAFKPLIEIYANKDMFTGRDIEPYGMRNQSKKNRYKPWTSKSTIAGSNIMSKIFPEPVVLSPIQIQHLIRGYTGWAGAHILGTVDFIIKKATGEISPEKTLGEYKWNPVESLYRELDQNDSKYVTLFYNNLDVISREFADIKKYRESPGGIKLSEIQEKRLAWRKRYNKMAKRLSRLRTISVKIYKDKNMTAHEKRVALSRIRKEKNALTKKIVSVSRDVF
jgi:hypothetical protein